MSLLRGGTTSDGENYFLTSYFLVRIVSDYPYAGPRDFLSGLVHGDQRSRLGQGTEAGRGADDHR